VNAAAELQALAAQAAALERAGRWAAAAALFERIVARVPEHADAWYELGRLRRHAGQFDAALAAYAQALARGVSAPEEVHLNRAVIYSDELRRPDDAERELAAALQLAPDYAPALLNLANLHEDRGRREAARTTYERLLALQPEHWEALARLANASKFESRTDPLVARLEAALARTDLAAAERASLGFALGRALDAVGAYHEAFAAYRDANRASRRAAPPGAPPYDRARQERLVAAIAAAFGPDAPRAAPRTAASPAAAPPVFICGMFRSGSTLAEQVLAAHPRVTSGGELGWLPALVRESLSPFPEAMRRADAQQLRALADRYLAARAAAFPHADVLTDKRPDNFLYVGLIKSLFPEARIVHTVRAPLDNVLSAWFLHLDHSLAYATDLVDTAHYLRECRRLMAHWHALYGDDVLEFDYDAFVREPRPQAERLLAFCGLEWDERCLEFHTADTHVRTASVWQVREPLYRRSSGRWTQYAAHLDAARELLEAAGLHSRGAQD
jgi:tetratricopeptide (TPR) repeat protein